MNIYSMTATFGKLSHQTLTFRNGLNVIHAPNEWGKSTWCAFLVCMLYGIDTRERTTQTTLADKERYAPWSGEPMSGRIDLCWNGKNITIERHTKGRVAFGEFRAYETDSGLNVPELTSANCGQTLLGVERSVFVRSAFIKLTDLPVTQDEALRRRLNALVTTGDESGASDTLAQKLKDLRNKCRHNRTGLLPQAELQQKELSDKLQGLHALQEQSRNIQQQQLQLQREAAALENHSRALAYEASRQDAQRVEAANQARDAAARELEALETACAMLPDKQTAEWTLQQLKQLQTEQTLLEQEILPELPALPDAPAPFAGLDGAAAVQKAKEDTAAYQLLTKPFSPLLLILAILCLPAAVALVFVRWYAAIPFALLAAVLVALYLKSKVAQKQNLQNLTFAYGPLPPENWLAVAEEYCNCMKSYAENCAAYNGISDNIRQRSSRLQESKRLLTAGLSMEECVQKWEGVLQKYNDLAAAKERYRHAVLYAQDLAAVAKVAEAPTIPDELTLSLSQTNAELASNYAQQHTLQRQLGQCMGQMETLGQEEALLHQLSTVENRISRLEETYNALTLALQTLEQASQELQRRFAPRITQQAQQLFSRLTEGRYDRLQLTQDLSLHAAAQGEDMLHSALWRSDGTIDQLYLSLRLAVAEELIPNAPLVLDDAFARFDDRRLAVAMNILKELADQQQVIVFTCQTREREL